MNGEMTEERSFSAISKVLFLFGPFSSITTLTQQKIKEYIYHDVETI